MYLTFLGSTGFSSFLDYKFFGFHSPAYAVWLLVYTMNIQEAKSDRGQNMWRLTKRSTFVARHARLKASADSVIASTAAAFPLVWLRRRWRTRSAFDWQPTPILSPVAFINITQLTARAFVGLPADHSTNTKCVYQHSTSWRFTRTLSQWVEKFHCTL